MLTSRIPIWRRVASLIAVTGLALGVAATSAAADEPEPTGSISGTVTLPDGTPAEWLRGVSVFVESVDGGDDSYFLGHAQPEPDGTYVVEGIPDGEYTVHFHIHDYVSPETDEQVDVPLLAEYYDGTRYLEEATSVFIDAGSESEINVTLDLGHTISGKVTLPENAPDEWFEAIRVEAWGEGPIFIGGSAWVASDGTYEITGLMDADYMVAFWTDTDAGEGIEGWTLPPLIPGYYPDANRYEDAEYAVTVAGADRGDIDVTLMESGSISGTVSVANEDDKQALQGVRVTAESEDQDWFQVVSPDPVTGEYALNILKFGTYTVYYETDGYEDEDGGWVDSPLLGQYYGDSYTLKDATRVTVGSGGEQDIDVTLNRWGSISGAVSVADGADEAGLQNITVIAHHEGFEEDEFNNHPVASVDPDTGLYEITGLAPGPHVVEFWPGHLLVDVETEEYVHNPLLGQFYDGVLNRTDAERVEVGHGPEEEIDAVLDRAGTISGTVDVAEGVDEASLENVWVFAYTDDFSVDNHGYVDAETGNYLIHGLAPGSYTVEFAPGQIRGDGSFDPAGHPLQGQFYDGAASKEDAKAVVVNADDTTGIDATLTAVGAEPDPEPTPEPEVYTVTFDSAGGSEVADQAVEEGESVDKPADPTREGYTFDAWLAGDASYDFTAPVTGNVELTANWKINTYSVTFDYNDGEGSDVVEVDHNEKVAEPADPTRVGYTFTGWTVNDTAYDFETAVTGDITLTASWKVEVKPEPEPTPEPGPKPVPNPANLVDVSSNPNSSNYSQFHRQIQWLADTGVTRGWNVGGGKHEFRAKEEITREAMAAFMYRYAGSPSVKLPAKSPFTDVTPSNTNFYKQIIWLNQQGISTGWHMPNGTKEFRPKDNITRDAMAAFMYRFAGKPATTPPAQSPFADVSRSTQFYKEITWLNSTGISTGWTQSKGKPQYRPYDQISREAMAAFLFRYNAL